jgi:hypothetical protein
MGTGRFDSDAFTQKKKRSDAWMKELVGNALGSSDLSLQPLWSTPKFDTNGKGAPHCDDGLF